MSRPDAKMISRRLALAVRMKREGEDLTMRAAAKESGVGASTILRVERGEMPDVVTLARLCHWAGVDARYVLGCEGFQTPQRVAAEAIARRLDDASAWIRRTA